MKLAIKAVIILIVVGWIAWEAVRWTIMRQYVGPNQVLVVINKYGPELPPERITVGPDNAGCKGILEEVLGPGRYFINPVFYDVQLREMETIGWGDPARWNWDSAGNLVDPRTAPEIGLLTLKEGPPAPPGQEVVDPGFKGLQKDILTPGVYKLNPYRWEVKREKAWVVPPGSVGVVTKLVNDPIIAMRRALTTAPSTRPGDSGVTLGGMQRGVLDDVLQPGVYFVNPRMAQLTIIPIGYDAITLDHRAAAAPAPAAPARGARGGQQPSAPSANYAGSGISFFSSDGYLIEADFTVVWGRSPKDAPSIVRNIGTVDRVEQNVIIPAMKAACQNQGARFTARELMQGESRERFQRGLSQSLEEQVSSRNLTILLALIRNITIKDSSGRDQTEGLIATIQRANVEIERELTNRQKTETEGVRAQLQQSLKLVDVARETVAAETELKVAQVLADGRKKAAEIAADRDLQVAAIRLQMAQLEAQRTEILGRATAEVERLRNDAEARGAKMLVDALGSPAAYNKYIFARNFQPETLRLIFAGPGTLWTDLKTFQEMGAAQIVQEKK
jgi:hypothetical protein